MRLIDADALIENWQEDAEHMETEIFKLATYAAINDVKHAPTVEPERKTGKWIKTPEFCGDDISGFINTHFSCSECKKEAEINTWGFYILSDFCSHCGADMRGEQDEGPDL